MPRIKTTNPRVRIVKLTGRDLSIEDVIAVANARPGEIRVEISDSARDRIRAARSIVDASIDKKLTVYGLNTGFGSQAEKVIPMEDLKLLQRYLIVSHAVGVDQPLSPEVVRGAMLIRANTLSRGNSGVREEVVQKLVDMINKGVTPFVPKKGSLGASGDLAPLSHIALVMSRDPRPERSKIEDAIAEKVKSGIPLTEEEKKVSLKESGEAYLWTDNGWVKMTGIEAFSRAGIDRIVLSAKEGLALNNGSTVTAAVSAFAVYYGSIVERTADVIAALTVESVKGFESAFAPEIQDSRAHSGQKEVARRIRAYLVGSGMVKHTEEIQNSHNVYVDFGKVQDSYSIRCIPQIHGPVVDALDHVAQMLKIEINSSTDNPLIFPDSPYFNKTFSGGNFHGQYLGLYMDYLGEALAILGNVSERRIFKLVTRNLSEGLPGFLINPGEGKAGLMNGAMILQYTAAHLVSENKVLSHPASVDSITSSEDKEDFVSMGSIAANKAIDILKNTENILAIELWCDIIALRLRVKEGLRPSTNAQKILNFFASVIPEFQEDRVVYDEIRDLQKLIHEGRVLSIVEG